MLPLWLIPALAILVVAFFVFYLLMKSRGGSGTREEGRTVMDVPDDDEPDRP